MFQAGDSKRLEEYINDFLEKNSVHFIGISYQVTSWHQALLSYCIKVGEE